jgi:MFS family permease
LKTTGEKNPAAQPAAPPDPVGEPQWAGLTRSTIIIGVISLLADTSSEMIYPLLPIFITQTLAAPATVVGLIEGIATGSASLVTGISGWLSDRVGRRKPVAAVGYALTAISRPVIAFAAAWPAVLAARFADRFGKGIRSAPRDALLSETASSRAQGRAFGFERAMDSSGAVLGPLIGLALLAWAALDVRTIFLISCFPAALAALLILAVREPANSMAGSMRKIRLSIAGSTRDYKWLLLITAVFGLANSSNAFLILRAEQVGLSTRWTIIAYALYNAVAAALSMPAGAASDRFGRRDLLVTGYTIYAMIYIGFGAAGEAWMVWPLFAAYGIFPALTDGVAKALAVETSGSMGRATAIGIYSMVYGAAQIAASLIGGLLWDYIAPWATFYFGASLALIAVAMLLLLLKSRRAAWRNDDAKHDARKAIDP